MSHSSGFSTCFGILVCGQTWVDFETDRGEGSVHKVSLLVFCY